MRVTDEDVREVWREYRKTGAECLRNQLVEKYLPIVRFVAERLLASLPAFVEFDDLHSMGLFGLFQAIDRFDPDRGVQFKTYCTTRIRGAILDELRSLDWVPRLVRIKAGRIDHTTRELQGKLGREPTFYEVAKAMKLSFDEYYDMLEGGNATLIISLSDEWTDGEENTGSRKIDLIRDESGVNPMVEMHKRDLKEFICGSLTEREKLIIVLYYYEELSMKEIAQILGLTESRVCQIHGKVIRRLRGRFHRARCEMFY